MYKLCLTIVLCTAASLQAQTLRFGAAEADITPPAGVPMAGYYTPRYATGAHDSLHAKAMVLEAGGNKIALVVCDLVSLPRDVSQEARRLIQQRTGLAFDHVMITSNHSHTTPVIYVVPSRYNLEGEGKRLDQEYTASLPSKIADAVVQADHALAPAELRAGVGQETTTGFTRRYFMKDGSVGWNPGKLNPQILRPAAPVDTSLPVLLFTTPDAKPRAAYVNFAVHQDTTGGLEWSADYSYTLAKVLRAAKGPGFITLFGIGAAGNVNHIDVSRAEKQGGFEEAARIGDLVGQAALKAIDSATPVAVSEIRVSDRIMQVAVPSYSAQEIKWATETQATFGTEHAAPFLDLVKASRMLELAARKGKPLDVEVQVFTIGNEVAIAGFPGEMFAEFGLQLKQDSPYRVTILAELANGALSYIPNRIAYKEGNYEPTSARLPEGTGETLVDSAEDQMLQLFRQHAAGK